MKLRFRLNALRLTLAALALSGSALVASAQAATPSTAPAQYDWSAQGTALGGELSPILTQVMPAAVGIFALFMAPKIFRRVMKSFASG